MKLSLLLLSAVDSLGVDMGVPVQFSKSFTRARLSQPTNQPASQPVNQPTNQPTNQSKALPTFSTCVFPISLCPPLGQLLCRRLGPHQGPWA